LKSIDKVKQPRAINQHSIHIETKPFYFRKSNFIEPIIETKDLTKDELDMIEQYKKDTI